jgi:ADP-heptose:LPS heptosyltransferase
MKISVIPLSGLGDTVVMHIASHQLKKAGHDVVTISPHRFGRWLESSHFESELRSTDAIFIQCNHSQRLFNLRKTKKEVYTLFESPKILKRAAQELPYREKYDYVADGNRTMVENVLLALKQLFGINAAKENGFKPYEGLIHRRHKNRVAMHTSSGSEDRNWPIEKFNQFADWARIQGLDPAPLPRFESLEELCAFLYESGYFLGNDSGPGHVASCLKIPLLTIGKTEKLMRLWRPGWGGEFIAPPKWIPNFKGLRLNKRYWKSLISAKAVIRKFDRAFLTQRR